MKAHEGALSSDWHAESDYLSRFVTDLVAAEIGRLRPGGGALPPAPWPGDLSIDEQGLGLDSLERLSVAAALTDALHLRESGLEDLLLAKRRFGDWLSIAQSSLHHFDLTMTFRTSGSTGSPKACTHSLAMLAQEIDYLSSLFDDARRIVFAVPSHHIYGFLFTILLPIRLGLEETLDARQWTPQGLESQLRLGDLVISHPAHWALIAEHLSAMPAGIVGVTSTAPCPPAVAGALIDRGLKRLVQIYGSSETAGIGWRESAHAPYRLMPFWSRDQRNEQQLARDLPDGSQQHYPLQDRLSWESEELFGVCERVDGAVQVGGVNVFPERVRLKMLEHPKVAGAAVRLMARHEGARLKAFIVPVSDTDWNALPLELAQWVESELSAPERPKSFAIGAHLPVNHVGKTADWSMS